MVKNEEIRIVKKIYLCYKDDDEEKVKGYFDLIKETDNFIKIKTGKNVITLPYSRIIKIKENVQQ